MIGKLKTLALAVTAVLVVGAVSASVASAQQGFGTSEAPVTLTGTEIAGTKTTATAFKQTLECPGSTFTGHKVGGMQFLAMVYTTVTITPHYKQAACKWAGVPATIDMNGCDYETFLRETSPAGNKEHTYAIEFSIVCPANQEIKITAYLNAGDHAVEKKLCVLDIPPQFGLMGATIKSTTNGFFDINGTVKGIKVKKTATGIACPAEETNSGEMHLNITVGGHNAAGAGIAVAITE